MNKEYTIIKSRYGRETEVTGTLEVLNDYFGYTLERGHSWESEKGNRKVARFPKTIKSLVTSLNNSCYNCRNYSDYYELKE